MVRSVKRSTTVATSITVAAMSVEHCATVWVE